MNDLIVDETFEGRNFTLYISPSGDLLRVLEDGDTTQVNRRLYRQMRDYAKICSNSYCRF